MWPAGERISLSKCIRMDVTKKVTPREVNKDVSDFEGEKRGAKVGGRGSRSYTWRGAAGGREGPR